MSRKREAVDQRTAILLFNAQDAARNLRLGIDKLLQPCYTLDPGLGSEEAAERVPALLKEALALVQKHESRLAESHFISKDETSSQDMED